MAVAVWRARAWISGQQRRWGNPAVILEDKGTGCGEVVLDGGWFEMKHSDYEDGLWCFVVWVSGCFAGAMVMVVMMSEMWVLPGEVTAWFCLGYLVLYSGDCH
ncbi:hypothetical protein M0R45_026169 [Rubus argutus]|uniref:NADH dehydrogenase subunit 6 n=1 Tax=Rubus argutus TaxID=59490 RepID=A0AAW1WY56_RUBAR